MQPLRRRAACAATRLVGLLRAATAALRRHRRTLECAAMLGVVAVLSALVAWLSWQGMVDRRLELGGGQPAGQADDSTLTRETAERRRDGSGAATTYERRVPSDPATRPPAEAVPSPSGQGLTVGGGVLAAGVVSLAGVAGVLAGILVLRRYRLGQSTPGADDGPPVDVDPPVPGEDPDTIEAQEPWSDGHEPEEAEDRLPEPTQEFPDQATAAADDSAPPQVPEPRNAGARLAGTNPLIARTAEAAAYAPRERLYEKRASPRITYECAGLLQWRAGASPVTVLDLSDRGLRCQLDARTAGSPKPPEAVRAVFPVAGHDLSLTARVAWRKVSGEGYELGLEFRALSDDDLQLLRETCAAATGAAAG